MSLNKTEDTRKHEFQIAISFKNYLCPRKQEITKKNEVFFNNWGIRYCFSIYAYEKIIKYYKNKMNRLSNWQSMV